MLQHTEMSIQLCDSNFVEIVWRRTTSGWSGLMVRCSQTFVPIMYIVALNLYEHGL